MTAQLRPEVISQIQYFIPRLMLGGLMWGDIVQALSEVKLTSDEIFWDTWYQGWVKQGQYHTKIGKDALKIGNITTTRQAILNAASCFHWAEFMYFQSPFKKIRTRKLVTLLFEEALAYSTDNIQKLFIQDNASQSHSAMLWLPDCKSATPPPCVILINGLDSAKEIELMYFAKHFVERGIAALVFDGPGQGVLAGKIAMPTDFAPIVQSVINALKASDSVNGDQLGLFGVSFGGFLALQAASTLQDQVKACINLSGGFDLDNYQSLSSRIKADFSFVFKKEADLMQDIALTHLNLKSKKNPTCPILTIHGGNDNIFLAESCEKVVKWCGRQAELLWYPNEHHVCQNYFNQYAPQMSDWMANQLTRGNSHG